MTLGMSLLLVLLHDGPCRDLFGAPAIPPGLLGRLLDVLILPLLLAADAPHVLSLWHGDSLLEICQRQSSCQRPGSDPSHFLPSYRVILTSSTRGAVITERHRRVSDTL